MQMQCAAGICSLRAAHCVSPSNYAPHGHTALTWALSEYRAGDCFGWPSTVRKMVAGRYTASALQGLCWEVYAVLLEQADGVTTNTVQFTARVSQV
jgi:hypothetical protein